MRFFLSSFVWSGNEEGPLQAVRRDHLSDGYRNQKDMNMHFDGFATIADPNISILTSEFQGRNRSRITS